MRFQICSSPLLDGYAFRRRELEIFGRAISFVVGTKSPENVVLTGRPWQCQRTVQARFKGG